MSQVIETICDQCGARKGKTNHWFVVVIGANWFTVRTHEVSKNYEKDICGENCLHKALGDFLTPAFLEKADDLEEAVAEMEERLEREYNEPI